MSIQEKRSAPVWIMVIVIVLMISLVLLRPLKLAPLIIIENATVRAFSSILHKVSQLSTESRRFFSGLTKTSSLLRENEALQMKLRLKNVEIALMGNLSEENQRLRNLMKLSDMKDYPVQYADIVFRDGSNPYNFTINRGELDQIKKDQAVGFPIEIGPRKLQYYQLIGRVIETLPRQSRVLSVMDERSQISVRNMRNQTLGTLRYQKNDRFLFLTVHQDNDDFKIGDILLTSELSTLPKGLIAGIVRDIQDSSSLYKRIEVAVTVPMLSFTEIGILDE
jgi:rod shape-determining protein MreC